MADRTGLVAARGSAQAIPRAAATSPGRHVVLDINFSSATERKHGKHEDTSHGNSPNVGLDGSTDNCVGRRVAGTDEFQKLTAQELELDVQAGIAGAACGFDWRGWLTRCMGAPRKGVQIEAGCRAIAGFSELAGESGGGRSRAE